VVQKLAVVCLLLGVSSAFAADALFPHPVHLVRRIEDPFARMPKTVDQYCYGSSIVTVNGRKVTITDYASQQVTEIDHAHDTYSITRFDEIAKVTSARRPVHATTPAPWRVTPLGVKRSAAGRSVDSFAMESGATKMEIGIDRSVTISRDGAEALIGAAYPNERRDEHDSILKAAAGPSRRATTGEPAFGIPSEKSITVATESGPMTVRDSVLRIDGDLPPRDVLLIDPGATRVESRLVRFDREMHDADTLPSHP